MIRGSGNLGAVEATGRSLEQLYSGKESFLLFDWFVPL